MIIKLWKYYFKVFNYKLIYLLALMILGTLFEGLGLAIIVSILDKSRGNAFIELLTNNGINISVYSFLLWVFIFRGLVVWFANFETAKLTLILKQITLEQTMYLSVSTKYKVLRDLGDSTLINLTVKEIPNVALGFKVYMHMLRSVFLTIAYIAIPIYLAPALSIIIFLFVAIGLLAFVPIQKYLRILSADLVIANEQMMWRLKGIFNSIANIKASNRNEMVISKIYSKILDILQLERKQNVLVEPLISSTLETTIFLLLIGTIVYNSQYEILEDAVLILVIGMLFKALSSVNGIYSTFRKIITYSGSFVKLEKIQNTLTENIEELTNKSRFSGPLTQIELKNISLKFDDNHLLEKISLQCKHGESLALVGRSGTGKTTILNILATLLEPQSGGYLVNENIPAQEAKLLIRNNTSYITQEYYFEEEFVIECFQDNLADKKQVIDSLLQLELIKDPSDFENLGAAKISNLSGGERQRLAIINEFLKEKTFYLLDEITSALNKDHENLVSDFINKNSSNKIIIAVTHSENFAKKFDRIINLEFHKEGES